MENEKMIEIKKVVLYFYTEFYSETKDKEVAIELTKEAMTTYRTLLIQSERKHEDSITGNQLNFLQWKSEDFEANKIIAEALRKYGKRDISELTKKEASEIISQIKGDTHGKAKI